MSSSFDDLSFAEPSTVSSRQFITNSYVQHPSDGEGFFYSPGQPTRIEISGMGQSQFILPRTLKLHYYAVSQTQIFDTDPPTDVAHVQPLYGPADLNQVDGVPLYGAPHLGVVQSEIPGLSSQLSPMVSDGYSQLLYTTRLMCSGDTGSLAIPGDKHSFEQDGQAYEAGGRSYVARADSVRGASFRLNSTEVGLGGGGSVGEERWGGTFQKYTVPASAWFSLCDGASSVLPLPYLTSSSSNLLTTITWAPATTALCNSIRVRATDLLTYKVTGVHLGWTSINIVDSEILGKIQRLFRGQVSLPIMQGVSIPVPMTMSHRAYKCAQTTLQAPSGSVSLRIPAGVAAANAFVVRVLPAHGSVSFPNYGANSRLSSAGLCEPRAIIQGMQIEIGSARFPSRALSDLYVPTGQVPRGLSSDKWALNVTNPSDARNSYVGGPTFVPTADSEACDAYRLGRQHMSLFDDDKFQSSPAAVLFGSVGDAANATTKTQIIFSGPTSADAGGQLGRWTLTDSPDKFAYQNLFSVGGPGLYIFNLQSLLQENSLRERGYMISGVDLRNQADVTLNMTILGTAPAGTNMKTSTFGNSQVPDTEASPTASAWTITAWTCFSELVTILPSRTDLNASSSLIPSAAGSVASS